MPSDVAVPSAALPRTAAWQPSPDDVRPEVKVRAVRLVEALAAWPTGGAGVAAARQRLVAAGDDPDLAASASSLLGEGDAAAAQVIVAQYGGIQDTSASVLVVVRQWVSGRDDGGSTLDVRLARTNGQCRVVELHPAEPGPPTAALSPVATRVLAEPRIELPPAALADVHAGLVHDSALSALLRLSAAYRIGVSVLRSGHPKDVFGTTRPSDHPLGRAVDTWTIDGSAVVDPATPRALVREYMTAFADAGSYNVGGPVAITGSAFFTDATHHDHVHAGFRG